MSYLAKWQANDDMQRAKKNHQPTGREGPFWLLSVGSVPISVLLGILAGSNERSAIFSNGGLMVLYALVFSFFGGLFCVLFAVISYLIKEKHRRRAAYAAAVALLWDVFFFASCAGAS